MTSKERISRAIAHQPVDHVPLYLRTFDFTPPPSVFWRDPFEKAERMLALGLDEMVDLYLAQSEFFHPEVRVRSWRERRPGETAPILCREYVTPAGPLRQVVRKTPDYSFSEIPLMDDLNVPASRAIEYLVKGKEDLPALRYLLSEPNAQQRARIREEAAAHKRFCDERGLFLLGWGPQCTDGLAWLYGIEQMLIKAVDEPEFIEEMHEIMHRFDTVLLELLVECGVDMIVCRGWYDTTDLWSPGHFRRFAKPRIAALCRLAHQAGVRFGYIMSTGIMPLLADFMEIGYDLHFHVDPAQGGADLKAVKSAFDGKIAALGGISAAITLTQGSPEEIRQTVHDAVAALGPTGFILSPVDCLFQDTPWDSVEVMIEAWKETW